VRPFLWPVAFLAAVTVAIVGFRLAFQNSAAPTRPDVAHRPPTARYYQVRPGDTLVAVAAKTGVSAARLRQLNPKVQPTALFIGQRIRLR
jgi:LysM repeat protein